MKPIELGLVSKLNNAAVSVDVSGQVPAIAARFSSRGLVRAVRSDVQEQIKREEKTKSEAPDAYRLSSMSEGYVRGVVCRGKDAMSGEDLLSYINETRARRTRNTDFSLVNPSDEEVLAGEGEKEICAVVKSERTVTPMERVAALPKTIKKLPKQTVERIRLGAPGWFNFEPVDTQRNTKRFPVSAFAAILALAMSLMLIVASSVLINQGENQVNDLTKQASNAAYEVLDLQSKLSVKNDLLQIRDVAVEEFGMVSEEYLQMDYLSLGKEDSIEVFEEERQDSVGLAALLSAIGIK
ncbi:MAG: hypothetical protein IJX13_04600 [Clostridia bacterium]|nr:hypothetical protein [Clostridia bacterium]